MDAQNCLANPKAFPYDAPTTMSGHPPTFGSPPKTPGGYRVIKTVALAIAAVLLGEGVETAVQRVIRSGDAPTLLFGVAGLYQKIVSAGPRHHRPRFTLMVDLNPDGKPKLQSCSARRDLATLVRRISEASPSVIAIDKYFLQGQCDDDPSATDALADALLHAAATSTAIVGRAIQRPFTDPLSLLPAEALPAGNQAIIDFLPDVRRVPLGWTVISENELRDFSGSFSLQAAVGHDPDLQREPRLNALRRENSGPYISFLPLSDFSPVPATAILCQTGAYQGRPARCATTNEDSRLFPAIRGRVVIVGQSDPEDIHMSPIGLVPGFVIHANFTEALLDGRYLSPLPPVADWILALAVFLLFDISLRLSPWKWALLAATGSLSLAALVIYILVIHFGAYAEPSLISIPAAAGALASRWAEEPIIVSTHTSR